MFAFCCCRAFRDWLASVKQNPKGPRSCGVYLGGEVGRDATEVVETYNKYLPCSVGVLSHNLGIGPSVGLIMLGPYKYRF